ncbi:MAG: AAA family ATPase [Thermodesulfobacteriota bacterium]
MPLNLLHALLALDLHSPRRAATDVARLLEEALDQRLPQRTTTDSCGDAAKAAPVEDRAGMQLEAIELANFLQFRQVVVDLRSDSIRPVILIEAPNGYGKSALVRAVRFALAGERESEDIPYFVHADTPGRQAEVKVVLRFRSQAYSQIEIRRLQKYHRVGNGWARSGADDLAVRVADRPMHGHDAAQWLEALFPKQLLDYFVFDAESSVVQKLSGQKGTELPPIQDVVETALAIRPLRDLAKWCDDYSRKTSKKARQRRDEVEREGRRRRDLEETAERLRRKEADERQSIIDIERELSQAQKEVDTYSGKGQPEQRRRRDNLLRELERARERQKRAEQERHEIVTELLPLALIGLSIRPTPTTAQVSKSADWRQGTNDTITAIAKAVSGAGFPWVRRPPPPYDEILEALRETVGIPATEDQNRARRQEERLASLRQPVEAAGRKLRSLLQQADSGNRWAERVREIQQEIDDLAYPVAETPWIERYAEASQRKNGLEQKLQAAREELKRSGGELESVREALTAAGPGASTVVNEIDNIEQRSRLADAAGQGLGAIADHMLKERVSRLEIEASQMLIRTAHKHDVLARLKVDRRTYRYAVVDKNDNPAPAGRSTGERNLLALCLVHAIREAAGARLPMVIEAPLRVLDPEHREAVLREMLAKCTAQMVLLVTPEEIPAHPSYSIRNQVAQRLKMIRGGSGEQTDIIDCPEAVHA